ncbi:uncharacterized protein EV154DRAFT_475801 [Mucor mucedo]|uniref:uncharacterized protein n=1 Tax=Mucor mucedo TaxID=29922 RepID=UPI00221FB687|nr:uncharacterized protein EV154DRAFT_475801 [Mucor mucedo]KAI7897006.1 hypothetical protein EV154DRAFT_475801 [Mucor mucedo]
MVFVRSLIAISLSVASVMALNVTEIAKCPALKARKNPAKDVTDLRIDDISVIAGLGDSIMAGFVMNGVNHEDGTGVFNTSTVMEYRGKSYAMGSDEGAFTLANFVKNYNPDLKGSSSESRFASVCRGPLCTLPISLYYPLRDSLNAAQSGAVAMNLDYELEYLIPRMKLELTPESYENDWKMINLQIGSNDQCSICDPFLAEHTTPEAFGRYVEEALIRIKKEIPKVVVNLMGSFKVSGVFPLSGKNTDYCVKNGILDNEKECVCSGSSEKLEAMDRVQEGYAEKLSDIAEKYKGVPNATFGVMYTPASVDIESFPITAFSNVDCFHPSQKGHSYFAKIYCPTESDRLPTKNE